MKLRILLLGSCIALAGCQTAPIVEQTINATEQQITTVAQLEASTVKLPSVTRVALTEKSQYLTNQQVSSPFNCN